MINVRTIRYTYYIYILYVHKYFNFKASSEDLKASKGCPGIDDDTVFSEGEK